MKKYIALIIAFSAILATTGCDTDKNTDNSTGELISSSAENNIQDNAQNSNTDAIEDTSNTIDSESTSVSDTSSNSNADNSTSNSSGLTEFSGGTIGKIDISKLNLSEINSLDGTKQSFGCGVNVDETNRPLGSTSLQEKYAKLNGLFIGEPTKDIYLTFDEGYENGYTTKILDVLKEKDCSAVFFVTMDYVEKNPDLINRMIDEGHVIGNHSVNHLSMPTLSNENAASEIADLHNYVLENFNYSMYLFRPPMGEFSERTLLIAKEMGYKTTLWSFAYRDWYTDAQPVVSESYQKVTNAVHDGAIYLLHAVSSTNTAILGDVIDKFRTDGYTVGAYYNK